jgi:hypothetical protein
MTEEVSTISSFKEIFYSMGEMVSVFGVGMIVGLWTMIKKRKNSVRANVRKEENIAQVHSRVHEALTELRLLVRASRTIVFQFHNGGKFADGSSIKRFSVTHESCGTGVQGMLLESQDVLLTRYKELVDILDNRSNKIIRTSDLPQCSFRYGLEINNVLCFAVSPLRCEDGLTPMGFVCCHWCDFSELDSVHAEGISENSLGEVICTSTKAINTHLTLGKH